MNEMTERDAVRAEFYYRPPRGEAQTLDALRELVINGMADEIVRLRAELADARATMKRVRALYAGWSRVSGDGYCVRCLDTLRALDGDA